MAGNYSDRLPVSDPRLRRAMQRINSRLVNTPGSITAPVSGSDYTIGTNIQSFYPASRDYTNTSDIYVVLHALILDLAEAGILSSVTND